MKVKINTKQRIIGIVIIVLILVGGVTIFTYNQFSGVATKVSETSKIDPAISKTRKVLFNISQAENQIRRYTLTEDSTHLENFHAVQTKVDTLLNELGTLQPQISESIRIDTFQRLVKSRFKILNDIALAQNTFRVEEAFRDVSKSIEDVDKEVESESKRKRGLFRRSAKKRKKEEEANLSKLSNNIRLVQEKATQREESLLESEFQLLREDYQNALDLHSIVQDIEELEDANNKRKVREISTLVEKTNTQVIVFCIVICLLLIFMSITILNYIRRNSAYRVMLKRAKDEAESLANAKALFIATVSHEIRTPINIISGFSEQLNHSELSNEQQEQLEGIIQSSSHLLDLVNSVLDFTKLEKGSILLETSNFSPTNLVSTVSSLLSKLAEENDVVLNSQIDPSVPEILVGDSFRIRQIFLNLIGNSIKFSKGGQVEISLKAKEIENASVLLTIKIADDGIGMSQEQLTSIFDEFVQANKSTTRLYGGTGLGLSITKKLVELQEGQITIDSDEGVGTTVNVSLPLEIGHSLEVQNNEEEAINLENINILVVDDEPFNRKLIRTILEKHNASFFEAVNGKEAINLFETERFDLILMDIHMPIMDGFEAAKEILDMDASAQIIALTATSSSDNSEIYKSAGMTSYLGKPFKQKDLLNAIRDVLWLHFEKTELLELPSNEEPQEKVDNISFADLKHLSNGDTAFYIEMLETFEHSTRHGFEKIQLAVSESDWKAAGEVAHRICAPCKHLSANTLYQLLKQIEESCLNEENLDEVNTTIEKAVNEFYRVSELIENERLSATRG